MKGREEVVRSPTSEKLLGKCLVEEKDLRNLGEMGRKKILKIKMKFEENGGQSTPPADNRKYLYDREEKREETQTNSTSDDALWTRGIILTKRKRTNLGWGR